MVDAEPEQYERHFKLLQNFGTEPLLIGSVGSAAALKLALNQLIASLTTSFALSLAFDYSSIFSVIKEWGEGIGD